MTKGRIDPFTGDTLRWNLVGTWVNTKKELQDMDSGQRKQFAFLPVVDHTDPYSDTLQLEICSWQVNYCKSSSTPDEFVALCKRVLDYTRAREVAPDATPLSVPAKYLLPDFLKGRCTLATYKKWLYVRARELFNKDLLRKKPYAVTGSVPFYKMLIHQAVNCGGRTDPFTGDTLQWELIGTWNSSVPTSHDPAVMKKFALLPTVDHIDPASDSLEFEICSFQNNKCKSSLNPSEFVAMCNRIVAYNNKPKCAP
jgi:hypothetical protein